MRTPAVQSSEVSARGVLQDNSRCPSGILTPPMLFNLFLEKSVQETLHLHWWKAHICNVRFADDIDLMGGRNDELQDLTNCLVDRATAYGKDVSTENSKIMTISMNDISTDVSMNGQKLEEMISFKYLGAAL